MKTRQKNDADKKKGWLRLFSTQVRYLEERGGGRWNDKGGVRALREGGG